MANIQGNWQLVSFGCSQQRSPLPDTQITAEISENRISGKGTVNRYFTDYTLQGNQIKVQSIASTRMAGPPEFMQQEAEYFEALTNAESWQVEGDELKIFYTNGGVLTYTPVAPSN